MLEVDKRYDKSIFIWKGFEIKPIPIGSIAPDFETTDDRGVEYSKSALLGSKYLLYF